MIKIKHLHNQKIFRLSLIMFAVVSAICVLLCGWKIFLSIPLVIGLGVAYLWMLVTSEVILSDDILICKFGPITYQKIELRNIRMVVQQNTGTKNTAEIISHDNKSILIDKDYKNANRILDCIGRYCTEMDLDTVWIEE